MDFQGFLINEAVAYLGQKVGDILTALQELSSDGKSMNNRDLVKFSQRIVANIRRIIHNNWRKEEEKYLKILQKVGVALAKAIDDKEEILPIIDGASQELEQLSKRLGVPLHQLNKST